MFTPVLAIVGSLVILISKKYNGRHLIQVAWFLFAVFALIALSVGLVANTGLLITLSACDYVNSMITN